MFDFDSLSFTGRVYPGATVTGRARVIFERGGSAQAAEFAADGKGREITEYEPAGWWRNFAEIDLDDDADIEDWLRRRGDPSGRLSAATPGDTGSWYALARTLKPAAALWLDGPGGTSIHTTDKGAAGRVLVDLTASPIFTDGIAMTVATNIFFGETLELRVEAKTLAAFLVGSAAFQVHGSAPLRRCVWCDTWFNPKRSDARFDTPACRQAHHQAGKGA